MSHREMLRRPGWTAVAVVIVLVLLSGCGSDSTPPTAAATDGSVPVGSGARLSSIRPSGSAPASGTVEASRAGPTATATEVSSARPSPQPSAARPSPRPSATAEESAAPSREPDATPTATPTTAGSTRVAPVCPGRAAPNGGIAIRGASRNWAGYLVTQSGARVTCVQGSWVEPVVRCPAKGVRSVAIWIGIDGVQDSTLHVSAVKHLVQIGTEADCRGGVATHGAWHLDYPSQPFSVPFAGRIRPGDRIAARITYSVSSKMFTMLLVDLTTSRQFVAREHVTSSARQTAEWIVEPPSTGCPRACRPLTLPAFAPVRFAAARATIGGRNAAIDGPWTREVIDIVAGGRTVARTGPLVSTGDGFFVRRR